MLKYDYFSFLERIIDDSIRAASETYKHHTQQHKLQGALDGLNACRGLMTEELSMLLLEAKANSEASALLREKDYWRQRIKYAEIEWVCQCVSVVLLNEGHPVICNPNGRAFIKVFTVLNEE